LLLGQVVERIHRAVAIEIDNGRVVAILSKVSGAAPRCY
jgi:hypothetical protein